MVTSPVLSILLVGIFVVTCSTTAHAYIDPGSTSFFLQGVVGAIAALIVVTKGYWRRAFGSFRRTAGPKGPR